MEFSCQLYSFRDGAPLDDVLGQLKALGYDGVEGWGGMFADPTAIAASLRRAGLTMPTAHFALTDLKDTARALKIAETVGIRVLFCPAVPQDQRSQDDSGWNELADTLAALGETYTKAGYGFGWHNHDFEFKPTTSGTLPMDIILERAPDLQWEVDVAWMVKAGQQPETWLQKYGSRITAIHVKDIAPQGEALDEGGWADLGHGTLDWQALFTSISANTRARYFVMEHDKPSDGMRFARRSIAAARTYAA